MASRQLSVSAALRGAEVPPARADAIFKVTMVPGDGVGPELMTAVKDVFKVCFTVTDCESPRLVNFYACWELYVWFKKGKNNKQMNLSVSSWL